MASQAQMSICAVQQLLRRGCPSELSWQHTSCNDCNSAYRNARAGIAASSPQISFTQPTEMLTMSLPGESAGQRASRAALVQASST